MLNSKWILTYTSILYLAIFTGQACAFGADGHRIVVGIAENHLSEKTALEIGSITDDLAELSLWPDKIRGIPAWKKSKYWHYINVPDQQQIATAKRSSRGDVLSALNLAFKQLKEAQLSDRERLQALSFFIHFAADIHQPLHVGRGADRGGNSIAVKWPKKTKLTNLHWVWDSGLLHTAGLSVKDYISRLDIASEKQIQRWQQDSFLDWAEESKMLRSQVYEFGIKTPPASAGKKPQPITKDYINRNRPIIEQRLLMAGIRLAGSLNAIFDPQS
ncbi:MAG: S1/P1 nuclease [Porticoccaceae bacterium]